jgi:drug/metabolite transporter (DMT)-like permease
MSNRTAPRIQVVAAFAAVYLIWGSTYLGMGLAVQTIPPHIMAGSRFLISGLVLFALARVRGAPMPSRVHWRSALVIGIFLLALGNASVAWAEERVPSGLAALTVALVPLWMVLIDWLRPGGVRPRGTVFAGVALGLVGMVLLIGPAALGFDHPLEPVGLVILVLASVSWALGSVFGSVYARNGQLPRSPIMLTGMEMLVGGVFALALAIPLNEFRAFDPAAVSVVSLGALLYLILIGSFVGFTAYVFLLQVSTPAKVSTYAYVNPVVAVFLGWALVGEQVTPLTILATAVIATSVAVITIVQTRTTVPAQAEPMADPDRAGRIPIDEPKPLQG